MATRTKRGIIDLATQRVSLTSGGTTTEAALEGIPPAARTFLALVGLRTVLIAADDPQRLYADLSADVLPKYRGPTAPAAPSRWRVAIARALAVAIAVSKAPKGKKAVIEALARDEMPAMLDKATAMDKAAVTKLRQRADVQEAYRALFGTAEEGDGTISLLEACGVIQPVSADAGLPEPANDKRLSFDEACAL